jgi:endonuclease/exonuclease/phosphatase family metal-dependent hydrolase
VVEKGVCFLKLIQLNTWSGRLERQISNFLKKQDADVLCLQEAISFDGNTGMFTTIEDIQKLTGLSFSAIAPKFSFRYMDSEARFSNSILSRFPIQKSELVFTNSSHIEDFNFNDYDRVDARNFVHAVIKVKSSLVNVITHHGHHIPSHKNGDAETMRQMKQVGDYIDTLDGPVVLSGDFNLAPHSESLEQINKRLINLPVKYKLRTTRTPLTHKTEVCDYIFVNDKIKVNNFYASDEVVSDHKALIFEFDL